MYDKLFCYPWSVPMKFLAYITVLCFGFTLIPFVYAQDAGAPDNAVKENVLSDDGDGEEKILTIEEAKSLIDSLPTAKDAIKGTVKQDVSRDYYDIYGRQLAYRENVREFRTSLEERRKAFEAPRIEVIENHRSVVDKVYAAEMKAYNEAENNSKEGVKGDEKSGNVDAEENKTAKAAAGIDIGLSEREIPSKGDSVNAPRKKVITSSNAPDFDPSNL